jgi:hypothetical protein
MKIFNNFAELNLSSLVEAGGETMKKLTNISNIVMSNMSDKAEHVLEVLEEKLFVINNATTDSASDLK